MVTLNHVTLPTVQALGTMGSGGGTPITTLQGWPQEVLSVLNSPGPLRSPDILEKALGSPREGGWWGGRGQSGRSRQ